MIDTIGMVLMFMTFVLFIMAIFSLLIRNGKAKKRFKWTGIFFVAMMIVAIIASPSEESAKEVTDGVADITIGKETDDEEQSTSRELQEESTVGVPKENSIEEAQYTIGDIVTVGNFEYTVTSVAEENVIKSGNQFIDDVTTEAKFVIIDYSIKNMDIKARMLDGDLFKLVNYEGVEYSPLTDFNLMIILEDNNLFLEEVNPGLSRKGIVVFEVPSDLDSYDLEVSSGLGWSGGEYEVINLK